MKKLKETILEQGCVLPGGIIKVDGFLNHRLDVALIEEIAAYMQDKFEQTKPNVVLTIEASGIAIAYATALRMGLPVVFAKKGEARNIGENNYKANIHSYTRDTTYAAFVSKAYLNEQDRVLIIDDFLANGQAALGLVSICEQAGAKVVGVGIAIEKQWQRGSQLIRDKGLNLHSAAVIEEIQGDRIQFAP